MIVEPTLEHYAYYLCRVEGDNSETIEERRAAFEEELRTLLAHLEQLSGQTIPAWEWPLEDEDRRISQRIMHIGWLDNPATGRSCFVEAGTYGDVYWLQVGYSQQGQDGPGIFASLRDEAWQPSAPDHLLGSSSYLCGIAAEAVDELAAQAMAAYTGDTPGMIASTRLANGYASLYGLHKYPHVTVLFYPNAECEAWAGRTILNSFAPRLELYKHKAGRQLAWCEENFPILSRQEELLRGLLEKVNEPPVDPELLRQLIRLYRVFSSNAGMLTDRQVTIGINLDNLDVVLEEPGPLAEDHFLCSARDRLRGRQNQLEADLTFADQSRRQAEGAISALTAELGLDRLVDLQVRPDDADLIKRGGFPGALPQAELEIDPPQINTSPQILLTEQERNLLQHVYRGYDQVLVKKEFGGGYGGTRVLLTLPVRAGGRSAALRVTKLGFAPELRGERDNYERYVGDSLPYCAAPVEGDRYYEQDNQAGLSYLFVGGGALGETMDLEEYYRKAASSHAVARIIKTLDYLLGKELGQRWYVEHSALNRFFAAEYGRHMVEHLRLRLRPGSPDALWPVGQPPDEVGGYRRIEVNAIPHEHETIQPGTPLFIDGLVVRKIRHGLVKLQDSGGGQGIVVRVEFEPESDAPRELKLGAKVGVRAEVVYNRRDRMEKIVRAILPDPSPDIGGEHIELPGVPGTYPNPLRKYPTLLGRMLERSRKSYVHGDLHLRNVLVDEFGIGRLIDFARVEERHNLFDFIKLETYVRLMGLAGVKPTFSLNDYVRFEKALAAGALGRRAKPPGNPQLLFAYEVIMAIRDIARNYMARESNLLDEYLPGLFLYCLAVMKYYQDDAPQPTGRIHKSGEEPKIGPVRQFLAMLRPILRRETALYAPQPTQLVFVTACVLCRDIPGIGN